MTIPPESFDAISKSAVKWLVNAPVNQSCIATYKIHHFWIIFNSIVIMKSNYLSSLLIRCYFQWSDVWVLKSLTMWQSRMYFKEGCPPSLLWYCVKLAAFHGGSTFKSWSYMTRHDHDRDLAELAKETCTLSTRVDICQILAHKRQLYHWNQHDIDKYWQSISSLDVWTFSQTSILKTNLQSFINRGHYVRNFHCQSSSIELADLKLSICYKSLWNWTWSSRPLQIGRVRIRPTWNSKIFLNSTESSNNIRSDWNNVVLCRSNIACRSRWV